MTNAVPNEADFDAIWNQEDGASPSPQAQSATPAPAQPAAQQQEPAAEPTAQAAAAPQAPATAAVPEAPAQPEDDWIAALPAEMQERIKAERTKFTAEIKDRDDKFKALHGKVAPLQQQLARAQVQQPQPVAQTPATPATPAVQAESFFESPEWKQYEVDFPGDAKVLRKLNERQQSEAQGKISSLEQRLQQIESQVVHTGRTVQETVVERQINQLEREHADWREHNDSDEFWQWFEEWRSNQPAEVQRVYRDPTSLNSLFTDAAFVSKRLTEYKADKGIAASSGATTPAATTTPEGQQHPQTPAPTAPAVTAASVRLAQAASPSIKGGAQVPRGVPLESMTEAQAFDTLFAAEPQ